MLAQRRIMKHNKLAKANRNTQTGMHRRDSQGTGETNEALNLEGKRTKKGSLRHIRVETSK